MLLAELEIFHSRPIAPTRRIALGHLVLPCEPAPGFGGVLLAAVMSAHFAGVDEDLHPDLERLLAQVGRGDRVTQPRLRHRFQVDRHGLTRSAHRLLGEGDSLSFEFAPHGSPLQHVLGAVYALERLDERARRAMAPLMKRASAWRGPIGPSFVSFLVGSASSSVSSLADPRAWALDILGFPGGTVRPSKKEIMVRYRDSLRRAHPDHGGDEDTASRAIKDITEARRVLLDSL